MPDQTRQWWKDRLTLAGFVLVAFVAAVTTGILLRRVSVVAAVVFAIAWLVGATLVLARLLPGWVRQWTEFFVVWAVAMPLVRATGVDDDSFSGAWAFLGLVLAAFIVIGVPMKLWLKRADARRAAS